MSLPLIVAITGATGVLYGVEMLRVLKTLGQETHLILSEAAGMNLAIETEYTVDDVRRLASVVYNNKDVGAAVASGSFRTRGMIVAPCTVKTLSAIANSFTYNLVVRAADVQLKEGRKLVLMVRETPLHKGHLELMARAADCGAILLPPMPAFYHRPQSIMDIVHQSIGKALDQVGIEHDLFERWSGHGGHRRGARAELAADGARDAAAAPVALPSAAAVPALSTPSAVPAEPAVPATGR
ncbi:MAG: UbiX family flavin prenyltransferase [Rubrivivax sp.]